MDIESVDDDTIHALLGVAERFISEELIQPSRYVNGSDSVSANRLLAGIVHSMRSCAEVYGSVRISLQGTDEACIDVRTFKASFIFFFFVPPPRTAWSFCIHRQIKRALAPVNRLARLTESCIAQV